MTHPVDQRSAPEAETRSSAVQRVPKANLVKIVAASLVTVVVVVGWNLGLLSDDPEPAPPSAVSIAAVVPPAPVRRSIPTDVVARTDRGFSNPAAQCAGSQRALAMGRTQFSLVVICTGPDGLRYRGVRLSLRIGTQVDDVTAAAGAYTARNETATYTVSPTELVVSVAGGRVSREPMLEYVVPEQASRVASPAPAPRPPPTPQPAAAPPPPAKPNSPAPSRPSAKPSPAPSAPPAAAQRQTSSREDTSARRAGMGTGNVQFVATAPWRLHYSVRCPAGTPVGGSITGSANGGTAYYVLLRGNTIARTEARGRSLMKTPTGPIVVGIRPSSENCRWTVAFD